MIDVLKDVLEASFFILSLIIGVISTFAIIGGTICLAIFNPWWLLLFIVSIPAALLILRVLASVMNLIEKI